MDGKVQAGRRADPRRPITTWVPLALSWCLALMGQGAGAQTIQGTLLESGSRRPIMLGQIALLDTTMTVVERTLTDHDGRFSITAPAAGSYYVVADRLGYIPVIDGIVELEGGGWLPVEFFLRPAPLELEPIVATADREEIVRRLTNERFYDREKMGFGHFVPPSEIERRAPVDAEALLRGIPGLRFMEQGMVGQALFMRGGGPPMPSLEEVRRRRAEEPGRLATSIDSVAAPPGYCRPRLYVDGARAVTDRPSSGGGLVLDGLLDIRDIIGVEVYNRASNVPLQYAGIGRCGVILIWTAG